jgi:hypothetical protein
MPLSKEEAAKVEAMKPESDMEEYNLYMELFSDLMNALAGRDLMGVLECGETMASLDSREKQKAFCTFAGECIRKIFMIQQNMPELAGVSPEEEEFYKGISDRIARTFCSKTMTNIEKAVALIDRNVNSKIVFCDLVNRMFLSI